MAGFYDQNPVTLRIDKMRMKWNARISKPGINLVRWLVKPEEVRMVEAFAKLEATEYALLPDMFLTMECDFADYEGYEQALTDEFLARFEDAKALKELETKNIELNWDYRPFKSRTEPDFFGMMHDHLLSFPKFRNNMVIYLKPRKNLGGRLLKKWIESRLESLLPRMRIMVHDYLGNEVFDSLMTGDNRVSLVADLDMAGAMKEIIDTNAGSGNPRSRFAQAIYNMGQEAAAGRRKGVDEWGGKALALTARMNDPAMPISLYLAWGINMQILKEPGATLDCYEKAGALAAAAVDKQEAVIAPLLIQATAFKAAALFQQKKLKEAATVYETMAGYAARYRQHNLEMEARWQQGEVRRRLDDQPGMIAAYKSAFETGAALDAGVLKATRYPVIAKTLYDIHEHLDYEYADVVDAKMQQVMGPDWRSVVAAEYIAAPLKEEEEVL